MAYDKTNEMRQNDINAIEQMVGYGYGLDFYISFMGSLGSLYSFMELYPEYAIIGLRNSGLQSIIRKDDLKKPVLVIRVDGFNTGFVIGNKGRNINGTLDSIRDEFKFSKVKRINVATELDPNVIMNKMIAFKDYLATVDLKDRKKDNE